MGCHCRLHPIPLGHSKSSQAIGLALHLGFLGGLVGKTSICNAGDLGLIPGLGRSPGEGKGYHSSILSDFHFLSHLFGILHEGSFWNDLFLPFETLDSELQSYLDTTLFLLLLLCNKQMRYFSTQQLEPDNKHEFEGFPGG